MGGSGLVQTALHLSRTAPRWCWTLIAAVVATLGSLFGGMAPTPNQPQAQPCATVGGAGCVSPLPRSTIQPVLPVDPRAQQRLSRFYRDYAQADARKDRPGARCERMVAALTHLTPDDHGTASNAQRDAISAAEDCSRQIDASNGRIEAAELAYNAFRSTPSIASARAAASHSKTLTRFDRSREPQSGHFRPDVIDTLQQATDDFDELLHDAQSVAPLYRPDDPETLDIAVALAELSAKLAALSIPTAHPDLPDDARRALTIAQSAATAITKSDRRIAVWREALKRKDSDPVGFVLALSAATPFDHRRAADLANADESVREAIPQAARRIAEPYRTTPQRDSAQQLVDLLELASQSGAKLDAGTLATINKAKTDLEGSDTRLRALRQTAEEWQAWIDNRQADERNAAIEARVEQVLDAIAPGGAAAANGYDLAGMGLQERQALDTLLRARVQIKGRIPVGQCRYVSVYIDSSRLSADQLLKDLPAIIARAFQTAGFSVASRPDQAALAIDLSSPLIVPGYDEANSLLKRDLSLTATIEWQYKHHRFNMGTITASGAASDHNAAMSAALENAAKALVTSVAGGACAVP